MTPSPMGAVAVIFLAAILTNNIILSKFLGMCSFIAISKNLRTAWGMGLAVTFVTTCTAGINYAIYYGILVEGSPWLQMDLTYLSFLVFIMVIAGFVQLVEMVIERTSPVLHYNMGIFLPLITVNCAILGVNLFMIEPVIMVEGGHFDFLQTVIFALGSGLGYLLAICLMAGIRLRLEHADIPEALKGLGITMIITGLMAMAFMGFTGIVEL